MKLKKGSNFDLQLVSTFKASDSGDDGIVIEGYANTVSLDRAGDVIPKSAWETPNAMTNYLKNPIILAYHDHSKPIGTMLDYEVTDKGLLLKAKISKSAGEVYNLIKEGVLRTFSVGFRIHEAEWDNDKGIYFIKDVELLEVSVVSIPCNQDSVFQVAKSLKDPNVFEEFKSTIRPTNERLSKENTKMTDEERKQMLAELSAAAATAAATQVNKALEDKEAAKIAAEKAASEKAAAEARAIECAKEEGSKAAKALVEELKAAIKEKDGQFAALVASQEDQIIQFKDEIAQLSASGRNAPAINPVAAGIRGRDSDTEAAKTADNLVILAAVKRMGMFDTEYGKKAVNASSNIQVSSEEYETIFSTNMLRDIQDQLVFAPLFREVMLTSANLVLPVRPDMQTATWIDAAEISGATRTDATTGNAINTTLTQVTLSTHKLSAKAFMTEETSEDAILALVPILRQDLVDAHANSLDIAILNGSGVGQPKGLLTQAAAIGPAATHVTTAKADGTVAVTAKMIHEARRKLNYYGKSLEEVRLVVSRDAYFDLTNDPAWADIDTVGAANAIKLSGEVGRIYGMPVLISDKFPAKAVGTPFAVIVYPKNFVMPRQRGLTLKSDDQIEHDRRVFVATQRVNFQPLLQVTPDSGNGKGIVAIEYAAV